MRFVYGGLISEATEADAREPPNDIVSELMPKGKGNKLRDTANGLTELS